MKGVFVLASILLVIAQAQAVDVTGVALLEDETNHNGIRVLFEAISPSAVTDSTETNAEGAYSIALSAGVYRVEYTHEGYDTLAAGSHAFIQDELLPTVTLTATEELISGEISGILGPGLFRVGGDIFVAEDDSLIILPGTRLEFYEAVGFVAQGVLIADGTESDSIVLVSRHDNERWNGLVLNGEQDSWLHFVRVSGVLVQAEAGGGVTCWHASHNFLECVFSGNESALAGAGVFVGSGTPFFSECLFANNACGYMGGGLCVYEGAAPIVANCEFRANNASYGGGLALTDESSATIVGCLIEQNAASQGGGIYAGWSTDGGTIENCTMRENEASTGGGVSGYGLNCITLTNCGIAQNEGAYAGGGCGISDSDMKFVQCLIMNNESGPSTGGGGVYVGSGSPLFDRCTIAGNSDLDLREVVLNAATAIFTNTAIQSDGIALYFDESAGTAIEYCCISSEAGTPIGFDNDDSGNGPIIFGQLITTNANGDSCDTYYNIFEDPMFVDAENGDYHLLADSPCIDAGDPESELDPDGTVADIGAFYFPQPQSTPEENAVRPASMLLHQNYPNPFNAETEIVFELASDAAVTLELFDVTGRLSATLTEDYLPAGSHRVILDGSRLSAGMYFYRLTANGQSLTRKLVLLK